MTISTTEAAIVASIKADIAKLSTEGQALVTEIKGWSAAHLLASAVIGFVAAVILLHIIF